MKKLSLFLVLVFAGFALNAQSINVGLSGGLPSGDASDAYTFSIHLDGSYLWEVSEDFTVGGATGLLYSFGDSSEIAGITFDFEDIGYIPVAAAARYAISESFTVGADVGYAIGVAPSGIDSGFYYAPRAQYYISDMASVVAAYRGVSVSGGSFDFLTVGVEFKL